MGRVIVRASTESNALIAIAKQQMRAVMDGGLELHAYIWLYFDPLGEPPASQMESALDIFNYPIWQWWIDCEDTSPFSWDDTLAWIGAAVDALPRGMRGIYTSSGWWNQYTGGSNAFASEPLWVASWTTGPEPTLPRGWAAWRMWQWQADVPLGGKTVDLNRVRPAGGT